MDDFKNTIEARVVSWFEAEKKLATSDEALLLLKRMCKVITRDGKRARPLLLFLTYIAYGGKQTDRLIELGLALELHHQFLLIHDDIIDNDTVRYGRPNVIGYYAQDRSPQRQNIPEAMGLLAGDLLFSFSNQAIIKDKGLTDKQKVTLLNLLNDTNVSTGYGQLLDVYNLDQPTVTEERLHLTNSLKSALYSTQLPMQCAAILLNLSALEREKINEFAKPFGILFQLVDDYSDYFTNKSAFNNRPKYRDIREGKITYPLYAALKSAKPRELTFLKHALGNKNLLATDIKTVVAILEDCGAETTSKRYIESYFQRAYTALNNLNISSKSKQQFSEIIESYKL